MFTLLAIIVLALVGPAFSAVKIPKGIEKISSDFIRNQTTYYKLFTVGTVMEVQIFEHPDLVNKTHYYLIFSGGFNQPEWVNVNPDYAYLNPDINVIGKKKVRVYFDAIDKDLTIPTREIGVAYHDTLEYEDTPFQSVSRPIVTGRGTGDVSSPRLMVTPKEPLQLLYVYGVDRVEMVYLNDDGLTVESSPLTLFAADQDWEKGQISNLRDFERNGYIYIMYDTEAEGTVGVVRSREATGPYEKIPTPLTLAPQQHPAVTRRNIQDSLLWGEDDWPYTTL